MKRILRRIRASAFVARLRVARERFGDEGGVSAGAQRAHIDFTLDELSRLGGDAGR